MIGDVFQWMMIKTKKARSGVEIRRTGNRSAIKVYATRLDWSKFYSGYILTVSRKSTLMTE
jgi:hypothetical protein